MDIIFLHGLKVETTIGIFAWEREIKQTVILDLELGTEIAQAARSDRIEDTLNYKEISKRITEFTNAAQFQLVETLAEQVATLVLKEFEVSWLRLRINKRGALRNAHEVGVLIERGTKS